MWGSIRVSIATVSILTAVGCGSATKGGAPTTWMGSVRHVNAVGFINGENINIQLASPTADNTASLWCEREYQVPTDANGQPLYAMGHNSEVRIRLPVTINGEMRGLGIELKMHDFQDDHAGTMVPVIPRDDNNPPCSATGCSQASVMWLSWVWHDITTDAVTYKQAAQSGQFTAGEFTGSPGSNGLQIQENTGAVGGFVTGQWSATEHVSVSFDANCTVNDIDNG